MEVVEEIVEVEEEMVEVVEEMEETVVVGEVDELCELVNDDCGG